MTISLDDVRSLAGRARTGAHHTAKGVSAWAGRAGDQLGDQLGGGGDRPWVPLAGAAVVGFIAGMAVLGARKLGMQMTSAFAADWFRQLKVEHRMAESLFELGLRTKPHEVAKRTAVLAHLAYALAKHDIQEANVIYPALRDDGENSEAKRLAGEHFDIKTYLHDLSEMRKDDPQWIKVWSAFYKLVKHHVREEEEEVYPTFHERLSRRQNRHLTLAMNREGIKLA